MRHTRIVHALAASFCLFAMAASFDAIAQSDETLVKAVIVSRHGVRTPTISPEQLATWTAQPWPTWKEPNGALTANGARLATLVGRYQREYLAAQRVLPQKGCPAADSIYIYADVEERTKATAQGLIEGLAPGCGISLRTKGAVAIDGIFHPIAAKVCQIDGMRAQTAILSRVGGGFSSIAAQHRPAFDTLQKTLGELSPALCAAYGKSPHCTIADLPTALVTQADGAGVAMIGALSLASEASEIFLLEYADGKPMTEVGWGRAGASAIQEMLALHDVAFDLTQRTPYLAKREGSSLLARIATALVGRTFGGVALPDVAIRDAKLVIFVGHDTNIANIGGMLEMSWSMPGWQTNETPPAGALRFELREARDGRQRVYVSYVSQSAEQMRDATPLTLSAPPVTTPIRVPACSTSDPGSPCSLEAFAKMIDAALDVECVDKS